MNWKGGVEVLEWWQICVIWVTFSACKWVGRALLFRGLPQAVINAAKKIREGGSV